jgi:hypothetical protein
MLNSLFPRLFPDLAAAALGIAEHDLGAMSHIPSCRRLCGSPAL